MIEYTKELGVNMVIEYTIISYEYKWSSSKNKAVQVKMKWNKIELLNKIKVLRVWYSLTEN